MRIFYPKICRGCRDFESGVVEKYISERFKNKINFKLKGLRLSEDFVLTQKNILTLKEIFKQNLHLQNRIHHKKLQVCVLHVAMYNICIGCVYLM